MSRATLFPSAGPNKWSNSPNKKDTYINGNIFQIAPVLGICLIILVADVKMPAEISGSGLAISLFIFVFNFFNRSAHCSIPPR